VSLRGLVTRELSPDAPLLNRERLTDGRLNQEVLSTLPDDQLLAELTAIPGMGPWTVQGALIIALHREDVVLPGDLALRKPIRDAYQLDHLPTQPQVLASPTNGGPTAASPTASRRRYSASHGPVTLWEARATSPGDPAATMRPAAEHLARAFGFLGKRWTAIILGHLSHGPAGFRDLSRAIGGISDSVLSERLAGLAVGGLITREVCHGPR
jgi:hypothetical protein